MRCLPVLLVAASAALARADYIVTVPNARKVLYREFKADFLWEARTKANARTWATYGLTPDIELSLTSETVAPRDTICSFDLSYSVAYPFVNKMPGFSFGVVDALNSTRDGRHFYLATSYDAGMIGQYNRETPMTVVIGAFFGSMNGPFVGFSIPYTECFRLLGEHDTKHIAAGFEFKPSKETSIRWLFRDSSVMWSAGFWARF